MKASDLKKGSDFYNANYSDWKFSQSAYGGFRDLIKNEGILRMDADKRDLEDIDFREMAAWGPDLPSWIVNIMADFAGTVPFAEDFSIISEDWAFKRFLDDCDLEDTDWDVFWDNSRRASYATGMTGILVDKGNAPDNDEDAKSEGVYPYLTYYSPLAVLDFRFGRHERSKRPFLSYLKLLEADGMVKEWTLDSWVLSKPNDDNSVEIVDGGDNPIGEIPFFWFYNLRSLFVKYLGLSDIDGASHIEASIINATADIAQIMQASGFLMLARPTSMIREDQELKVGPREQIGFDADNPGGTRPFWLTPDVSGPTKATLEIIDKQERSLMRKNNLSAVFATISNDARSTDSIKQAFRFLESSLNRKIKNEMEARRKAIYFWLKWQGKEDLYEKITINHPMTFDITSLITTIQDAMTAKAIVKSSDLFQRHMDKFIVRKINPDISQDDYREISDEIDNSKIVKPDVQMEG